MKKVSGYILGSLVFSTLLYSAVPYSFKANTKAKASEVNSNFNSLDNRIITLENNITNIMNSSHNEKVCDI